MSLEVTGDFIENGGNVGIGTANPNATLDVNGDVNIANKLLLGNNAGNNGQALISGGPSSPVSWQSIAYANSDRFLFSTTLNYVNNQTFNDVLKFNTLYSLSSAISYNSSSGQFTVNKSGLYHFEGSFVGGGNWTVSGTATASLYLAVPAGTLLHSYQSMPAIGSGPYGAFETFPFSTTLYFSAGSTFAFVGVATAPGPTNMGFLPNSHVSIFLVAE